MMGDERTTPVSGRRVLLLGVAALVSAAAALAIGILLFGDFGATEGRILATTALLAGYGLLALPAVILQDQRRLPSLAAPVVALAVGAAAMSIAAVWQNEPHDLLAKAIGTVTGWLVASAQVSALAARQREQDPRLVRRFFTGSSALAAVIAAMFTGLLWAEIDREGYIRIFAALVVLDVLLVALQPILARARPTERVHRLRILVAPAETVELSVEAPDLATAASKALRTLDRAGRRALLLEFTDRIAGPNIPEAEAHEHIQAAFDPSARHERVRRWSTRE
jgi:hypothetical protein